MIEYSGVTLTSTDGDLGLQIWIFARSHSIPKDFDDFVVDVCMVDPS